MNIDFLSLNSIHQLDESATGAIAPLQGACSLASEHRFAGVAHAPRNPCFTFSGPLAVERGIQATCRLPAQQCSLAREHSCPTGPQALLLLVECSPRRRRPCRARLRLQAQTVPQACSMLHETPAAP